MKNITLSAEERLIEAARNRAREEHTTLNAQFRRWLAVYAGQSGQAIRAREAIEELRQTVRTGGQHFSREEMNER